MHPIPAHCIVTWCRRAALSATTCIAITSLANRALGGIVFPASGTSAAGNPVSFAATLSITGNTLSIRLDNTSPGNSTDAADVLTSFYFDIVSGTSRPTLTYSSASGLLYLVRSGTTDLPYYYTPQTFAQGSGTASNLRAVNNGDNSWQFRSMDPASPPNLGFGIGTVGNIGFSPNGFTPQIVGQGNTMINFAIYRGGDIDPNGVLNNKYLVKNTATFTFTGVSGYTEAHIVDKVVFGLGTSPDSTLTVALPEPAGCGLLAAAAAVLAARRARRRTVPTRRPTWPSHGQPSSEGRSSSWLGFPRRCGFASSCRRNTATTSSIGTT